jgi:hypothetical protein
MKITVEQENRKFTLEIDEDLDVFDMANEMRLIMLFMTYSSKSLDRVFK